MPQQRVAARLFCMKAALQARYCPPPAPAALQYLLSNPSVRLVLLDDGLQHLPLLRDLEIVMVNALQVSGASLLCAWGRGGETLQGVSK